ncbi:hypothetical protein [Streptomyces violascens]|uniref:hypothetical protein n=1 Tax=Streptomyces violascens TaxID=67381 RepID=UPI00369B747D
MDLDQKVKTRLHVRPRGMTLTARWRRWGIVALAGVLLATSGTGSAAGEEAGDGEVRAYAVDPPGSWYKDRCLYHGYDEFQPAHLPKVVQNVVMTCGSGDTWRGIGKIWTTTKYGQLVSGYDQAAKKYLCLDAAAPILPGGWAGADDIPVVNTACENSDAQKWSFADNTIRNGGRCLAADDKNSWPYYGFSTIPVVERACTGNQSRLTWKTQTPAGPDEQPETCWYIPDDNEDVSPRACFMWASEHHRDRTAKDYIFEGPDKWLEQSHDHTENRKRDVQEADVTLIISVQEFGSAAEHIRHATTAHPETAILTIDRSTAEARQRRQQTTRLIRPFRRDHNVPADQDVDEWPMAMFAEGGDSSVLSLMAIDRESNRSLGAAIANSLDGSNPANTAWPNGARVRFVVVDTNEQADNLGQALQAQDDQRNRADAVRVLGRVVSQQAEADNRTYLQQVTAGLQQQINAGVGLAALGAFAVHSFPK